jgi:hypothetical protein
MDRMQGGQGPEESVRSAIVLTAAVIAVTGDEPRVLAVRSPEPVPGTAPGDLSAPYRDALPSGPFDPPHHRTLESGLRRQVEEQTGLSLRYVEQLYTFGNRYRDPVELRGGPRVVAVGYLALVREAPPADGVRAGWRTWYDYLPWEDWRSGRPELIDRVIRPALGRWAAAATDPVQRDYRSGRADALFRPPDVAWDFEMALERYELLYEAGLAVEAQRDRAAILAAGADPGMLPGDGAPPRALGIPMALDHRRVLAAALGRLRGKLKYRPLVFELLPENFTLFRLQQVVEALSGHGLHKQNFRRLVIGDGLVEPTGKFESRTGGRPAELYRFRRAVLHERPSSRTSRAAETPAG